MWLFHGHFALQKPVWSLWCFFYSLRPVFQARPWSLLWLRPKAGNPSEVGSLRLKAEKNAENTETRAKITFPRGFKNPPISVPRWYFFRLARNGKKAQVLLAGGDVFCCLLLASRGNISKNPCNLFWRFQVFWPFSPLLSQRQKWIVYVDAHFLRPAPLSLQLGWKANGAYFLKKTFCGFMISLLPYFGSCLQSQTKTLMLQTPADHSVVGGVAFCIVKS